MRKIKRRGRVEAMRGITGGEGENVSRRRDEGFRWQVRGDEGKDHRGRICEMVLFICRV